MGWLAAGFGCGLVAMAQQPQRVSAPAPAVVPEGAGHDPASRAGPVEADAPYPAIPEAPADTGRMRHGWHDFSRYDWAGLFDMCTEAVHGAHGRLYSHAEEDTVPYAVQARTPYPPTVALVARRCGAGRIATFFQRLIAGGPASLDRTAFDKAYNLALALGPDADTETTVLLHTVLTRLSPDSAAMWEVLGDVVAADAGTRPLRVRLLDRDTLVLDSLAKAHPKHAREAAELVDQVPGVMWRHWLQLEDTARARAALEATLAVHRRSNRDWDIQDPVWDGLLRLTILQHRVRSPATVKFIQEGTSWTAQQGEKRRTKLAGLLFNLTYYEKPFVWPKTPYWYGPMGTPLSVTGDSVSDRSRSVPGVPLPAGKVTLIWAPNFDMDHANIGLRATLNLRVVQWLRQLIARYGAQGLQVVVLEHTRGSVTGSAVLTEEEEAGGIRHFYQDMLQLPAAVVVEPVAFKLLPDGRRRDAYTEWELRYCVGFKILGMKYRAPAIFTPAGPTSPILLDRRGNIRYMDFFAASSMRTSPFSGGIAGGEDPLIDLFIEKLLQEP